MKLTTTHKAVVVVLLAAIGAWLVYPVLRPARDDICASEILLNGRGGSINLKTNTVILEADADPVPLDSMTNDSQVLIDELSRLCRQHEAGSIPTERYFERTEALLRPAEKPPAATRIPRFEGTIGVTGLVDNRPFLAFAQANAGKIVKLGLRIDAGAYNPLGVYFLDKCYEGSDAAGAVTSTFPGTGDNLFGQRFSLIETHEDVAEYAEVTDRQKQIGCGPAVEFVSGNRRMTWSSGGPGLTFATLDGFYRIAVDYMGAGQTYRFEEVSGSVTEYAETQS